MTSTGFVRPVRKALKQKMIATLTIEGNRGGGKNETNLSNYRDSKNIKKYYVEFSAYEEKSDSR